MGAVTLYAFVAGKPATQGSKRHIGRGIMIESGSKRLAPWRADIREAFLDAAGQPAARFTGAVTVWLEFVLPRPTSTPRRFTPAAVKRPDVDKLERAVLDALGSAGIWRDDSQVVELHASKRLAELEETPGCWILVEDTAAVPQATHPAFGPAAGPTPSTVDGVDSAPGVAVERRSAGSEDVGASGGGSTVPGGSP